MKTKRSRQTIQAGIFAITAVVMYVFAISVNAQISNTQPGVAIRFTLPFEVYWGTMLVPAGQYTILMDNEHPAALVRSADGKTQFFTPIPITNHRAEGPAALLVVVRGSERMVRSLNLPKNNLCLTYRPTTSAEREILAKAEQVQAVPLASVEK